MKTLELFFVVSITYKNEFVLFSIVTLFATPFLVNFRSSFSEKMILKKFSSIASHIDCPTIDMNQAERAVSQLISDDERQFQRTISQHPRERLHLYYLPSYPTPIYGFNHHLLLPNVPGLCYLKKNLCHRSFVLLLL